MDSFDKIKYVKFPFHQFIKIYNQSLETLENSKISEEVKISYLQSLYDMRVETETEEEEIELMKIRESLSEKIGQPEALDKNR